MILTTTKFKVCCYLFSKKKLIRRTKKHMFISTIIRQNTKCLMKLLKNKQFRQFKMLRLFSKIQFVENDSHFHKSFIFNFGNQSKNFRGVMSWKIGVFRWHWKKTNFSQNSNIRSNQQSRVNKRKLWKFLVLKEFIFLGLRVKVQLLSIFN